MTTKSAAIMWLAALFLLYGPGARPTAQIVPVNDNGVIETGIEGRRQEIRDAENGQSDSAKTEEQSQTDGALVAVSDQGTSSTGHPQGSSKMIEPEIAETGGAPLEIGALPLKIGGFGDIYATSSQNKGQKDDFRMGQMEIALETNIDEKIIIGAAVAYDKETSSFALGAFTVDFHLFGSDGSHFRPANGIDHSGILVGQFDVPFGIDWEGYASIDRRLVTAPLAVELTHHAWNDDGVQGYIDAKWFNVVIFGVNGFAYQAAYHSDGQFLGYAGFGYDVADDALEIRDANIRMAAGGRAGIKPLQNLEIGSSYADFVNDRNKNDMSLLGLDLKYELSGFSGKGEYIVHQLGIAGENSTKNTGYYGEGSYSFGWFYLVTRFSQFQPDPDIDNLGDMSQLSLGGGWVVRQGCELRLEHQINSGQSNDILFTQLVVGF